MIISARDFFSRFTGFVARPHGLNAGSGWTILLSGWVFAQLVYV